MKTAHGHLEGRIQGFLWPRWHNVEWVKAKPIIEITWDRLVEPLNNRLAFLEGSRDREEDIR